MSPSSITLRDAQPGDVADILALVRELAVYEKLEHEARGRPEDLHEHLFGAQPYAHAIVAHDDGALAGFALYFFNYSTFLCRPGMYLEDLYVRPPFRRRGIGRVLLRELARRAEARHCGRLEWSVLDWNQPAIEFYKSLGARPMDEWTVFRLTGESLTRLAAG